MTRSITANAPLFLLAVTASLPLAAQAGCVTTPRVGLRLANTVAGSPGYVQIPDSPSLHPTQFTLETWMTPRGNGIGFTTDGAGATMIAKPRQGSVGLYLASWVLGWDPLGGTIIFGVTSTFGSQGVYGRGAMPVPVNTTAHVALTLDGSNLRLYVNGVLDTQLPYPFASVYYGTEAVLLGQANYGANYYRRFDGELDEVRIWDHARTNEQILGGMHCRASGSEAGLLACYTFDQSDARDSGPHANHGTLLGSAGSFVGEHVALSLAQGCPKLSADVGAISLTIGGAQQLHLQGTPAQTGRAYLVVGTSTGTLPGFASGGLQIPLNPDSYLSLTVSSANAAPIFVNTLGVLDGNARATATIALPGGAFRALAGLFLEHAFVVLAPAAPGVSQPVPLTLRP